MHINVTNLAATLIQTGIFHDQPAIKICTGMLGVFVWFHPSLLLKWKFPVKVLLSCRNVTTEQLVQIFSKTQMSVYYKNPNVVLMITDNRGQIRARIKMGSWSVPSSHASCKSTWMVHEMCRHICFLKYKHLWHPQKNQNVLWAQGSKTFSTITKHS